MKQLIPGHAPGNEQEEGLNQSLSLCYLYHPMGHHSDRCLARSQRAMHVIFWWSYDLWVTALPTVTTSTSLHHCLTPVQGQALPSSDFQGHEQGDITPIPQMDTTVKVGLATKGEASPKFKACDSLDKCTLPPERETCR